MATTLAIPDASARITAMTAHDRTLLVEAGAGVGKTALLAGRILFLLAAGTAPRAIAAVTFTELAASQLLARVQAFAEAVVQGTVPVELAAALPHGPSEQQLRNLQAALEQLGDLTCSTIHGFCQRLITPYPVEGNLDPGASVLDKEEADGLFKDVLERWIKDTLSSSTPTLLGELVYQKPGETIDLIGTIARELRSEPALAARPPASDVTRDAEAFIAAVQGFKTFLDTSPVEEPDSLRIGECFLEMAERISAALSKGRPAALAELVTAQTHPDLCKVDGDFRKYRQQTRWIDCGRSLAVGKAQATDLFKAAEQHHARCCATWKTLLQTAAATTLGALITELRPALSAYRSRKRSAALLDFDDLIVSARDLLRDNEDVRSALRQRYLHLLVDEFQDTDPRQSEIFWLLASDEQPDEQPWPSWRLRAGALFLVGDPKQSIYRFRGADTASYQAARTSIEQGGQENVITITTNFRSCAPIIEFVNKRFEAPMSEDGQPGFHHLDAFHPARLDQVCVAALDIRCADGESKISADAKRDAEADGVAELCGSLIGSHAISILNGGRRPCRPGDIALLAPSGTDLWRYEEALERAGVPVTSQAGKGLLRRQEIQDLIALTRILADPRDTLALTALLRGPLVGLTERQLLDLAWTSRSSDERWGLSLDIDATRIYDPVARLAIERLQQLRRRSFNTTPHDLLAEAIDTFRVRPLLGVRHGQHVGRALSNLDTYLEFARRYDIKGLRAFAEAMRTAWEGRSNAVEGRVDAPEDAVSIFTVHSSKGLEWPIVIPINMMTQHRQNMPHVVERAGPTLHAKVLGTVPPGHAEAVNLEQDELKRERQRLWYVAATRARELLVLPRLDTGFDQASWGALVDLGLDQIDHLATLSPAVASASSAADDNAQSLEIFLQEQLDITSAARPIRWTAPSAAGEAAQDNAEEVQFTFKEDGATTIGSAERGLILHKLIEEMLTGEVAGELATLTTRAAVLTTELGASDLIDPAEVAAKSLAALALDKVASLRHRLVPEVPILAAHEDLDGAEVITVGVIDALVLDDDGRPEIIIDWKSDVSVSPAALAHYQEQVRRYLFATGAKRGMIVLATPGQVIEVTPGISPAVASALAEEGSLH